MPDQSLGGKIVVVTGAGSGVGRATALALAAEGVRLVLVGRRDSALRETASLLAPGASDALIAPAEVADEAAVARVVVAATERFGGVDALVCAAGVGHYGPVASYSRADWDQTLATNLTGVFLCCRAVLPALRARGGGAIVAIGSGAGKQGYANLAAYSASKFGLLGFMQSLAAEVGPDRIKVSTILPGSILTDFAGRPADEKRATMTDGKRYLTPEDVAAAVVFLLMQPPHAWTQELNLWPF